jgi:hypothetical protein
MTVDFKESGPLLQKSYVYIYILHSVSPILHPHDLHPQYSALLYPYISIFKPVLK